MAGGREWRGFFSLAAPPYPFFSSGEGQRPRTHGVTALTFFSLGATSGTQPTPIQAEPAPHPNFLFFFSSSSRPSHHLPDDKRSGRGAQVPLSFLEPSSFNLRHLTSFICLPLFSSRKRSQHSVSAGQILQPRFAQLQPYTYQFLKCSPSHRRQNGQVSPLLLPAPALFVVGNLARALSLLTAAMGNSLMMLKWRAGRHLRC